MLRALVYIVPLVLIPVSVLSGDGEGGTAAGVVGGLIFESAGPLDWQELEYCLEEAWCAPNERAPIHQMPFVQETGQGIQVAVGTERGFMALGLNENLTGLVLADYEMGNVFYNRANVALLQVARDRQHYLHLRLDATHAEWQEALKASSVKGVDPQFLSPEAFEHWRVAVRSEPAFTPLHRRLPNGRPGRAQNTFVDANYLYDDKLYDRVAAHAKAGRIKSIMLDLNDEAAVKALVAELKANGERLAIFDPSNAFDGGFGIDAKRAQAIAANFLSIADEKSKILVTRLLPEDEDIVDEVWEYDSRPIKQFAEGPEADARIFLTELRGDDPEKINPRSRKFCITGFARIR